MDLIKDIDDLCSEHKKMFLPNPLTDSDTIRRLTNLYNEESVLKAAEYYIKSLGSKPFLIFDFAANIYQYIGVAEKEAQLKEEYEKVLKDTKGRLDNS